MEMSLKVHLQLDLLKRNIEIYETDNKSLGAYFQTSQYEQLNVMLDRRLCKLQFTYVLCCTI